MTTIWKFKLLRHVTEPADGRPESVSMPDDAKILAVQVHHGDPHLWAIVDPEMPTTERMIETFATGVEILTGMGVERRYIGTYQMPGSEQTFHVFERIN